ncbi:hypothetical protein HDU96_009215 [Phlyctochytrium bullatum]|nr:hypothetical protein HDU96_009215 [Phlyctochytrium bullatum]
MGQRQTLKIQGEEHIRVYQHFMNGKQSENKRSFCIHCSSPLWCTHDIYPDWFWPFAGAIDSDLPPPRVVVHIMLGSKAAWCPGPPKELVGEEGWEDRSEGVDAEGVRHVVFREYPKLSIQKFHEVHGLLEE